MNKAYYANDRGLEPALEEGAPFYNGDAPSCQSTNELLYPRVGILW